MPDQPKDLSGVVQFQSVLREVLQCLHKDSTEDMKSSFN